MGTAERSKKEPHDGGHNSRADKTGLSQNRNILRSASFFVQIN